MKIHKIILTILIILASMVHLYADSQVRPKTSVEKEFYNTIIAACSKAVETINTTWAQTKKSGWRQNDNISEGSEDSHLTHYFRVAWQDKKAIEAASNKAQQLMAASMQKMNETDNSAATTSLEELAKKMGAAAEAGDFKEMARLQKEAEKLSKQIKQQLEPAKNELENIVKENAPRDARLKVRIAVNLFRERFAAQPKIGKLKNGLSFYRVENGRFLHEKWVEGITYVFLGDNWQLKDSGEYKEMSFAAAENESHTTVRSIIIEVEAAEKRALQTLKEMNLQALQGLINKSF